MLQQDPYFLFSRRVTYFGNFQHLEDVFEIEENQLDEVSDDQSLSILAMHGVIETHITYSAIQPTGLYLHWIDA